MLRKKKGKVLIFAERNRENQKAVKLVNRVRGGREAGGSRRETYRMEERREHDIFLNIIFEQF